MIMNTIETYSSTESKQRGDYLEFLRNAQEKHPGRISDWQLMAYLGVNL
jgi:thiosulfate reductase cytochrome b subunit